MIALVIVFNVTVPVFAVNQEDTYGSYKTEQNNIETSYEVLFELDSSFGKVYYIQNSSEIQLRTVWDAVDVVMAGVSWATFFGEPSFANLGWAVLDTAALAPVIPSSAYIRKAGKMVVDPNALKTAMMKNPSLKGKLLKGLKGGTKAEISKVVNQLNSFTSKRMQFDSHIFLLDKSGMKHILQRHHPVYWNGTIKASQSFFHNKMTVTEITNAIQIIMSQNRNILIKKGTNAVFQITGRYNGVQYTIGINKGKVQQFYRG